MLKRRTPTGIRASKARSRCARELILGLLAVLSLPPAALSAQTGGVEGRVLDSEGPPVFAANILLALPETPDQVDRIAESDRFGYYRIESLPPGRYLLRVQRIGYGDAVQAVNAAASWRPRA